MNDEPLILSYLAGVIDSDGCIGIRRNTYAMRVRKDAGQPVYSERIDVKQVEPQAVTLLHEMFGGSMRVEKPNATRGRPLYAWQVHSAAGGRALVRLRPYLRIKTVQADNALELRSIMGAGRKWPVPEIVDGEPLVSVYDFAIAVGVKPATIFQACRHLSIPSVKVGQSRLLPASYIPPYRARIACGGRSRRSADVSDEMERLYQRAKELNKVGI